MADRRRNPDLPQFRSLRDIAERALRTFIVVGAIAGWVLGAHAVRAYLIGA